MGQHFLTPLFRPRSVALFGASERADSVGALVFTNLLEGGFEGELYAINPKRDTVQGQNAYPSLEALGRPVDLAVIATPAHTVPAIIDACGEHGVRAAVVLSAGFREIGPEGVALERAVLENARRHGLRFMGPNCLGLMRPDIGLNATFNKGNAQAGNLALVSQSGALCTSILDWAQDNDIGFSAVVSMGTSADLDFGEVLDFLVTDTKTASILLYIEGIHEARRFMSAIRAAARIKPVIAVKVGRHAAGSNAAKSHSGALVGQDDAFDAALRRAGVVRVLTIGQLFAAARTLASRYRASGRCLAIVTNGGGPAVMAADRAADIGMQLAQLSDASMRALDEVLPPTWSHGNPIDVIGDATPERYEKAVSICLNDPVVDGVLVILTPQAMTRPLEVADAIVRLSQQFDKPLLTCWMGGPQVEQSRDRMTRAKIPSFHTPEAAVEAFSYLTAYAENQRLLLQTPGPHALRKAPDIEGARMIIEGALGEHRKILGEMESKAILRAFHIPTARTGIARSPNEALVLAEEMGFPVAMKINSPDIVHKSDAGGVRLNISTAHAVRSTYNEMITQVRRLRPQARIEGVTIEPMCVRPNARELIVGIVSDPVFGPIITFGAGGTSVEVIGDRAVSLPPLNRYLTQNLIRGTRVSRLLGAFRHLPPVDMDELESVLLRVSEMACELPWLREMDINPLIVDDQGAVAVDARMVIDFHTPTPDRYRHMAIYPYPSHLVSTFQLPDGRDVVVRPIRPEDAEIEQAFVRNLSERSRYYRFMQALKELTPTMLVRFTQIDYDREMALIAVLEDDGRETQLAVVRYAINPDGYTCEFALAVADEWRHQGIAHRLMTALMDEARDKGLTSMEGDVLAENQDMLRLVKSLHFDIRPAADDPNILRVSRRLG